MRKSKYYCNNEECRFHLVERDEEKIRSILTGCNLYKEFLGYSKCKTRKESLSELIKNMKPVKLDPNDPEIIRLIEETKRQQEEIKKLQRIDPDLGNLFVGN